VELPQVEVDPVSDQRLEDRPGLADRLMLDDEHLAVVHLRLRNMSKPINYY
jgi:hypothetical protein